MRKKTTQLNDKQKAKWSRQWLTHGTENGFLVATEAPETKESSLLGAAKAALKYVDDLNEDVPIDPDGKECVGRVYFNQGTPEPPLCWIHQLKALVSGGSDRRRRKG